MGWIPATTQRSVALGMVRDRSWRALSSGRRGSWRSHHSAARAVQESVGDGDESFLASDRYRFLQARRRAKQVARRQFPDLFGLAGDLGAGFHQQRPAGGLRDQQARRHSRARDRAVDVRCRRPDRAGRAARGRGHRIRRSRRDHGVAYQRRPRRAAKSHPQPHPLHLHAGLRGRRTHAGRDGDRRDAALAKPARDQLARRRQEGVALVSDRQRLRLAVALAPLRQEIHRRHRRARRRRGVRPARRGQSRSPSRRVSARRSPMSC